LAIKYYKLFDILQRRDLKKTDLIKIAGISSPTLAKLSKGETITTEVIEKICKALDVQPGDIMEIPKNQ
jgi:DNA-binding Xre family transcriptional regulator